MKTSILKRLSVSALALATALSVLPAVPAAADDLHCVFVTRDSDGKQIWYENNVQQGTLEDPQGILGDGTNRGREIFDPATGEWYWLDAFRTDDPNLISYDGAKAVGKEVWIPYVYQEELVQDASGFGRVANGIADETKIAELAAASKFDNVDMSGQVADAIRTKTGKWVRYDQNGAMMKGWVTINDTLAVYYPNQKGNTYYYDNKTGLMAKGWLVIDGIHYHFDETTGVMDDSWSESSSEDSTSLTLRTLRYETHYEKAEDGTDHKTEYEYGNANFPSYQTKTKSYTWRDNAWQLTNESDYEVVKVTEGNSSWTTNREVKDTNYSQNSDTGEWYVSYVTTYEYATGSRYSDDYSKRVYTSYRPDGTKYSQDTYTYTYDDKGYETQVIDDDYYYGEDGTTVTNHFKSRTEYAYNDKGRTTQSVQYHVPVAENENDTKEYISSKSVYEYDENGNETKDEYWYSSETWDSEKEEYVRTLNLSSVSKYEYEQVGNRWRTKYYRSYAIKDGKATDTVSYETRYFYNSEGKQIKRESWSRRGDKLVKTSIATTTYGENGYDTFYRSLTTDQPTDSDSEDNFYVTSGSDDFYKQIADPTYSKGYRMAEEKEIWYINEDKDGTLEVNYWTAYDTEFTWSTTGLNVGDQKTSVSRTYNADNSLRYTYTTTYEVVEYRY